MTALVSTLAVLFQVVTLLVGTFVAYQSYRGYRRNDSRAMLALALGIVLLIPVAYTANFLLGTLGTFTAIQSELVFQTISIFGLIVVFYGFIRT